MGRILGIDYGEKRVGLAVSDSSGTIALPLEILPRSSQFIQSVKELMVDKDVDRIVVGLPRNMDGSLGPKAREVLAFKEELQEECRVPVETWDERLTTVQAIGELRRAGASRRKQAQTVDRIAAQILLQSYLDSRKQL